MILIRWEVLKPSVQVFFYEVKRNKKCVENPY